MNLMEVLHGQSAERPDQAALIETRGGEDSVLSFSDLERLVGTSASAMRAAGLRKGDRVLFLQGVSTELYLALLAVFRLGAVAVFVDPSAGWKKLRQAVELARPAAVIAGFKGQLASWAMPELWQVRHRFACGRWCLPGFRPIDPDNEPEAENAIEACGEDDPALLTFTSGSTGRPKAAMRTHGFLLAQHRTLASSLDLQPGETDLATLPIFVLANLASGVTTVLPDGDISRPGFVKPGPIWGQIRRTSPTRCAASPAFFDRLCGGVPDGADTRTMVKLHTGGAPVFPRTLRRMKEVFPASDPEVVYGSTEAEPISHARLSSFSEADFAAMRTGRGLPVGRPVPEITLAVIRDQWGQPMGDLSAEDFRARQCGEGESGEIVVTGDHVLKSYWQGHGEDKTKFAVAGERWHRTGDAGRLEADGRLWLLGRCGAKLADRHGVCHPFGVECAASFHPAVRRSALLAWKRRRLLLVELEDGANTLPEDLAAMLGFAHLDAIRPVPRIPVDRRHNAKIDYPALEKLAGQIM